MDKRSVHDLCNDALATCNSINTNLICLQSRIELGLPVDETAKIIDVDMQALDERVETLRKAIMDGDEDGCKES